MMNWQLGSDGMGAGRMSKRISTREIHERWFYRERDNADEFIRISKSLFLLSPAAQFLVDL